MKIINIVNSLNIYTTAIKEKGIKYITLLICLVISGCSLRFSEYSKYNKIDKTYIRQLNNAPLSISFQTEGCYNFYFNRKYKPTKEFDKKQVKHLLKRDFKVLTIAETNLSPYYTLIVQYRKKHKTIEIDSVQKSREGHFDILSKEVYLDEYCFLFTFIMDSNQPFDLFEDYNLFYTEFNWITSSVMHIEPTDKYTNDTLITYWLAKKNPLLAIKYINQINLNKTNATKTDYYLELKATAWAFTDELDSVLNCIKLSRNYSLKAANIKEEKDSNNIQIKLVDGYSKSSLNHFLEEAKQNRIVIINENHQDWRHRYVASILIDSLKKAGYSMLAMEALSEEDCLINKRKYPIKNSGYYTQEPFMANLIRNACKSGFTLFPYDVLANREEAEADNINTILKQHPNEKLVVYCGWGHISQNCPVNPRAASMACFLKTKYGFNPLTINQTLFNDCYTRDSNNSSDFILKKKSEINYMQNGKILDLQNLDNNYYAFNSIKNISEINADSTFNVDISKIAETDFPILISVYNKTEADESGMESIPVAVKYVYSKGNQVLFKLKKGKYIVRYTGFDGNNIITLH